MVSAVRIRPWDARIGDVILGTGLTITGRYTYTQGDRGSDRERQFYTLPLIRDDGTETRVTYNGESYLTVLREDDNK